jgi:hypothetical protein
MKLALHLSVSVGTALLFLPLVSSSTNHATAKSNPDGMLVVDCLLPGAIRKLGGYMTYQAPRQPIRATADECEIRGGEYVAYDRANFATAFQVWMPKAKDGDAQAQTYVGEIYEKGMGQPSDPQKAAEWYQKAADRGYPRALSNLAYLYEKGLGVAQDPVKALNLYRRAAGITDDQLTFESEVTTVRTQMQGQLDALAAQLEQQTQQAETLQQQLDDSEHQINQRRAALDSAHREVSALKKKLADAQGSGASDAASQAKVHELEGALKEREAQIAQQQTAIGDLERTAAQRQSELENQITAANSQGAKLRGELGEKSSDSTSARVQLAAAQERLKATGQEVVELRHEIDAQRTALAQETERLKHDLQGANAAKQDQQTGAERSRLAIAEREAQLKQQSGLIASLETKENDYQQQIAALQKTQADEAQHSKQQVAEVQNVRAELALAQQRSLQTQHQLTEEDQLAKRQAAEIEKVRADLAQTQQQYQQTQRQLSSANATMQSEHARVSAEQADLEKRLKGTSSEQIQQIKELTQEVSNRDVELIEQRAKVAALEAQKGEYSERIAQLVKVRSSSEVSAPGTAAPAGHLPANIPKELSSAAYYALIIGNDHYKSMPNLDTPINDAQAVAGTLKERYGFKTRLLADATRIEILSAINDFKNSLKPTDNLLIYYAGHGELDQKNLRGYWLPIDARRDDTTEWISDQQITDQIALMAARHVLIVADSCYSGVMTRSSGVRLISKTGADDAEVKRLTTLYKLPSRTVLSSGTDKPVLDGGGGSNSIFARALVDILNRNDGILEGSALYNQIFDPVRQAAAKFKIDQSPRYDGLPDAGHMNGEFLFIPRSG